MPNLTLVARDSTTKTASNIDSLSTEFVTIFGLTDAHVTIPGKTIAIAILTCIQTITPDTNGYVLPGTCGVLYHHYPSFAAALVATVIFGVLNVVHVMQAALYKKVYFIFWGESAKADVVIAILLDILIMGS